MVDKRGFQTGQRPPVGLPLFFEGGQADLPFGEGVLPLFQIGPERIPPLPVAGHRRVERRLFGLDGLHLRLVPRDLPPGVGGLRGEVFPVEMEGLEPLPDLAQFAFVPFDVLSEAVDPEFREVELGTEPEEFLVPLGDQGGGFFPAFLLILELRLELCNLFGKLGDFTPVAQQAPVVAVAAPARQDAARTDDVPLRRDEGAAEAVLPPEGDAAPEVGDQKDVAQQFVDDRPAILPDRDLFDQRDRLPEMFVLCEGGAGGVGPDLERDETSPAEGGAFQVVDRPDAVRLILHHDVLELFPEDRLDGRLVLPGDADVVGDEAQEELAGETRTAGPLAAGHQGLDPLVAPGVALFEFRERGESRRLPAVLFAESGDLFLGLRQLPTGAFQLVGDLLPPLSKFRKALLVDGKPGAEFFQRAAEFRRPLPGFLDLPDLPRLPFPEVFDHPGKADDHVFQLGLFGDDVDVPDLLFLQSLPAGPVHPPEFFEGLRPLGDLLPERPDPLFRLGRGGPEGGDFAVGLTLAPFQGLAFRKVLRPSCGKIGDFPSGEFDPLFLDIDSVFRAVAFFLVGRDQAFVFEDLRLQFLQGGLDGLQARPDLRLPVLERLFCLFPGGTAGGQVGTGLEGDGELGLFEGLLQSLVLLRPLRLAGDRVELGLHLAEDVVQADHVLPGRLHLPDRGLLPALVFGDAGRLLDELPPIFRLRLDKGGDAVLLDEGVGPGADPRAHEEFPNVQEAARNLVDRVFALPIAEEATGDHHLAALRVIAGELLPIRREGHGDLGHPDGGGLLRAVEDHVVHLLPAEGLDPLLAHDPADRVGDVALAAAVGADDAADPGGEIDDDLLPEGFETGDFESLESHLLLNPLDSEILNGF